MSSEFLLARFTGFIVAWRCTDAKLSDIRLDPLDAAFRSYGYAYQQLGFPQLLAHIRAYGQAYDAATFDGEVLIMVYGIERLRVCTDILHNGQDNNTNDRMTRRSFKQQTDLPV